MTELSARMKWQLRDVYHLSPILWSVIRGDEDTQAIARRLAKPLDSVERGVLSGVRASLLKFDQGRIVPMNRHHRDLFAKMNPDVILSSLNPVLDVMGDQTLSTKDIADLVNRPYHSTYKTLQRLQARGEVTRVDKRWRRVLG